MLKWFKELISASAKQAREAAEKAEMYRRKNRALLVENERLQELIRALRDVNQSLDERLNGQEVER